MLDYRNFQPLRRRVRVIYKRKNLKIRKLLGLPEPNPRLHQGRRRLPRKPLKQWHPKRPDLKGKPKPPEQMANLHAAAKASLEARRAAGLPIGGQFGRVQGVSDADMAIYTAQAKVLARRAVTLMAELKIWEADNDKADEAMRSAIEVLNKPASIRDKIQAAKLVLDFTQRKPAAATDVTVHNAEAFLNALLDEEKSEDESGTSESPKEAS